MAERVSSVEMLQVEECDAWLEYLESCRRACDRIRYDDIEVWAWARLQQRLAAVAARRRAVR